MRIGFAIPTYNRADNLRLVLHGLELQTSQGFDVVVCDHGSTDDTLEVTRLFDVSYCRLERTAYDPGAARNTAVQSLSVEVTHIWFLDSDVILNPEAVEHAVTKHLTASPEVIITGRYDWLKKGVRQPPFEGLGIADQRQRTAGWDCNKVVKCSGAALTGNLVIPVDAFEMTGGFDPNLAGSRSEDCEMGFNMRSKGLTMVMCEGIIGYHLAHPRIQTSEEDLAGTRRGVRYIHEKYDIPLKKEWYD